jgi:hypothetical protein
MQEETSANSLVFGWNGAADASERRMIMGCSKAFCSGRLVVGNALLAVLVVILFTSLAGAQDAGWPKTLSNASGKLVCYQPQVDDWQNYQTLDVRLAFTFTPTGGKQQVGVITAQMQTSVNFDTHTVFLSNPQVTSVTFPSLPPDKSEQLGPQVRTFLNPAATMTISLDRLAASVKKTQTPPQTAELDNTPPEIFVSIKPAILLLVNGQPSMANIANSNLQLAPLQRRSLCSAACRSGRQFREHSFPTLPIPAAQYLSTGRRERFTS